MRNNPKIVVAGAGSIGCFVGGLLVEAGHDVHFLGRKRMADEIAANGLHLTDYTGLSLNLSSEQIPITQDATVLVESDIVLICTKSAATAEMALLINTHAPNSTVVSLQNGVRNAETLRVSLPKQDVRAGMVAFNVIHSGNGHFHRGTSGEVMIEKGDPDIAEQLQTKHVDIVTPADIQSIQWGKLLMNLNNAVNAVSGIPLKEQLSTRSWRRKMADQIAEALAVMKPAGITPKPPTPAPAWLLPHILRLPDFLFEIVARQMLSVDPKARTSMAEDIDNGKKTEIDEFQGEIIRLGEKHGILTPSSRELMAQIRKLEEGN